MEPSTLSGNIQIRQAVSADLPQIVRLLADDPLGSQREAPDGEDLEAYVRAFAEIDADPNNELLVIEAGGRLIGTLQLTYIPSLTFQGSRRAQIEGVRLDKSMRRQGIGRLAVEWAIERARQHGCRIIQLTTNKARAEALSFYLRLGFESTHEGLKLYL